MPTLALVVCPPGSQLDRRLLGLTIGERLLLDLKMLGIERVAFTGGGARPTCDRAALVEQHADTWGDQDVLVIAADTVFDRSLVNQAIASELPLAVVAADDARAIAAAPQAWLAVRAGRADAVPGFALRVTDDAVAHLAKRVLLRSLRKPIDGFVSRHLNRYVSTFLSSLLVRVPVRPNQLTIVFTAIGLAAGVVAAIANPGWLVVLGAVLFQTQSILDGCDGEVARLTYRFSRSGQWLDSIGDDVTNYAFCFGLAIGQAHVRDLPVLYYAGAVTLAAQLVASGLLYRRMMIMGTGDLLAIPDRVTGHAGPVMRALRQIAKRDTFVLVIAVLAVIHPVLAFVAYAVGTLPMLLGVIENERRLARGP